MGPGGGHPRAPCPHAPRVPPRLRLGAGDVLTFYDGDDLTARILGQYTGARGRFKLFASSADVTIQFQSDPGAGVFAYRQGFVIHFSGEPRGGEGCGRPPPSTPSPSHPAVPAEVPRNDTCPELPDIANGWKTASQPELLHGTVVTFHCYPGFELAGTDLLMCHWDLTWSGDLPSCERGERGHPMSPLVTPSLVHIPHLPVPVPAARSHHLPGPRGRRAQPQGGLQPQIPGGGHRALRLRQGLRAGGRRAPHLPRPRLGGTQVERPPAQVHP